ncbi:hypothetical protein E5K00_00265 [Hymenobacter aquaticus]|uniref:Uncharacterized protein n=1 Tax=Hymenobacter aquaticus TaxID=1867101 RepID=A0A4Z0Q0W4_9BACT|nr:hypothetical protein [Hymenobacter aquaticus]TGE23680.1 hypothetical protein E5K00_00265 [Hymenobacter aquaticus]
MGENSAGCVGYANAPPVRTPCYGFTLTATTLPFRHQLPREAIGVAPHYRLRDDEDWLAQTLRLLQTDAGR